MTNIAIEMVLYSEFSHSEYVIFPSYIGLQEGISFSRQQHHPSDYGPNPTAACAFASEQDQLAELGFTW